MGVLQGLFLSQRFIQTRLWFEMIRLAIADINEDPQLLPNNTLTYYFRNSYVSKFPPD